MDLTSCLPAEMQRHADKPMTLSDGPAAPQEGSSGAPEVRTSKMTPHDRRNKGQNRYVEAIGAGTPDTINTFNDNKKTTFLQDNQSLG